MPESFFELGQKDQREALEYARAETGRPAHLLEKDIWVVWTLRALFDAAIGADLTFKGGTSLSKAYKVIDRFSEDIDLTYDIRKLIPDLTGESGELPGVLGFFRPKTTIIAESPAIRGLQEGIAFSEVHIYTNFG